MNRMGTADSHEPLLHSVNAELARLLHREPAELITGADMSAGDELVICGILGGKDVGKSTLINALAEEPVSVDHAEVGEGTTRPIAYAHRDVEPAVRHRLGAEQASAAAEIKWHDADTVRNAVLVDLPDFDSQFQDHLEIVRAVAPVLDRIIWVVTPRKIGDREWVRMLQRVVKDISNVYVVLNKADELLTDDQVSPAAAEAAHAGNGFRAELFWRAHEDWVTQVLAPLGEVSRGDRRFLLAAGYPDEERFLRRIGQLWDDPEWVKYGHDQPQVREIARRMHAELQRLRSSVLGPITRNDIEEIKRTNRRRQIDVNVGRIRRHYELDRVLADLEHVVDPAYQQRLLDETVGPETRAALAADVACHVRLERDLADELLDRRLERWPLLRLAYWPFGWLARVLAPIRSFVARDSEETAVPGSSCLKSSWTEGAESLLGKIELLRSTLFGDHAALVNRLQVDSELPEAKMVADGLAKAAQRLPQRLESEILATARAQERPIRLGTALGRMSLWFILLWFPLIQPVASGLLAIYAEEGTLGRAHGLYRIVSALSAAHLLAGLAVVAVIYVAIIAGMYVRSLRSARRAMQACLSMSPGSALCAATDELLVEEVVAPMVRPFERRRATLRGLLSRLEAFAGG